MVEIKKQLRYVLLSVVSAVSLFKKKTFCKPVIQKREEKKTIYATIQNEEKPNTV